MSGAFVPCPFYHLWDVLSSGRGRGGRRNSVPSLPSNNGAEMGTVPTCPQAHPSPALPRAALGIAVGVPWAGTGSSHIPIPLSQAPWAQQPPDTHLRCAERGPAARGSAQRPAHAPAAPSEAAAPGGGEQGLFGAGSAVSALSRAAPHPRGAAAWGHTGEYLGFGSSTLPRGSRFSTPR